MRSNRFRRIAGVLTAAVFSATLMGCAVDPRLSSAPLAVVLHEDGAGTRLTAVDLSTLEVIATRRLRSRCYSMDGDTGSRTIVTAQTGGVGPDADDAAGIWRMPDDKFSYLTLPYPNPSSVAVAQGTGYVMHGFQIGDSLMMSAVSLLPGGRVTTGTASEWARDPEPVGNRAYMPVSESPVDAGSAYSHSSGSIELLDPSLESSLVAEVSRGAMRLVDDPTDDRSLILVGTVGDRGSASRSWHLTRVDTVSGDIAEDKPLALRYGVMSLAAVGDDVAIADADCVDLDDPGRSVVIVDGRTLTERRRIEVTGTPAAVAEWRGRLLVYDGIENELLVYASALDTRPRRLRLGGRGMGNGDIVVFDSPSLVRE